MIKRVIFTIPPICGAETEFCINDLDTKPIFRFVSVMIEMQSVMNLQQTENDTLTEERPMGVCINLDQTGHARCRRGCEKTGK